jgi:hypothetical protein
MLRFLVLGLALIPPAFAQNENLFVQCIPHIAAGGGWSTSISIYNLRETVSLGTLNFYDPQGQPMPVAMQQAAGLVITDSVQVTVEPNGSRVFELPGSGPNLQQGYAILTRATGSMSSLVTFRQHIDGRADYEATVPGSNVVTKRWAMLFDNTGGASTSFAIVNPDRAAADFQFTFFDSIGVPLTTETIRLRGGQQQSFSSSGRWSAVANRRGTVQVSRLSPGPAGADFGVNVFALRFNPTGAFSWIYMEPPTLAAIIQVIQ